MKVLFITPEWPYPLTSGFLRYYRFLEALAKRHEITLMALTRRHEISPDDRAAVAKLTRRAVVFGLPKQNEPRRVRISGELGLCRLQRALRARNAVREMSAAVKQMLAAEPFDLVLLAAAGKDTVPLLDAIGDMPLVADCCDADQVRYRSELRYARKIELPWLALRYLRVRRLESRLVSSVASVAFASERDRAALLGADRGEVIPQGVDISYWKRKSTRAAAKHIVFTGVMSYPPNHDAAMWLLTRIVPMVRKQVPDASVAIVGRNPRPELCQAAEEAGNAVVTGQVPDIRPYLESATVFAAPIRFASGIQNKVLEAMAMELPVVTTPVVGEGLRLRGGAAPPILLAETADGIAEGIIDMLQQPKWNAELGRSARVFVAEHFVWDRSFRTLEMMCEQAVMDSTGLELIA